MAYPANWPDKPESSVTGADLDVAAGYGAAQRVAICLLATLKAELGDLSKVSKFVRLQGFVNADPAFTDHSKVVNGASDLFAEIFGTRGAHARAAVGMNSLPGNIAIEITLIVEVAD